MRAAVAPAVVPLRRCLRCDDPFTPARPNHYYCGPRCRRLLQKKRSRRRAAAASPQPPRRWSESALLLELREAQLRIGGPEPRVDAYLMARAGVLEAEEQCRRWTRRLQERRLQLQALPPPALDAQRFVLELDAPAELPRTFEALGLAASGGDFAVVLGGRRTA